MVAQPDGLQHIGPTSCETEMYTEIWLSEEEFLKSTWKWKQLPLKMRGTLRVKQSGSACWLTDISKNTEGKDMH